MINVYPSQNNNNQTLWIFSGSSTTHAVNSIRTPAVADSNNYNVETLSNLQGGASITISHLFLDDDATFDEMGIHASGSALSYSSGTSSAWVGAGIINKPIGDFFAGTFNNWVVGLFQN